MTAFLYPLIRSNNETEGGGGTGSNDLPNPQNTAVLYADTTQTGNFGQTPLVFSWQKGDETLTIGTNMTTLAVDGVSLKGNLFIKGSSAHAGAYIHRIQSNTPDSGVILYYGRSRDSGGAENIVQDGDVLGELKFGGYDSAEYITGTFIRSEVNGTPSLGAMPTDLVFQGSNDFIFKDQTGVSLFTVAQDGAATHHLVNGSANFVLEAVDAADILRIREDGDVQHTFDLSTRIRYQVDTGPSNFEVFKLEDSGSLTLTSRTGGASLLFRRSDFSTFGQWGPSTGLTNNLFDTEAVLFTGEPTGLLPPYDGIENLFDMDTLGNINFTLRTQNAVGGTTFLSFKNTTPDTLWFMSDTGAGTHHFCKTNASWSFLSESNETIWKLDDDGGFLHAFDIGATFKVSVDIGASTVDVFDIADTGLTTFSARTAAGGIKVDGNNTSEIDTGEIFAVTNATPQTLFEVLPGSSTSVLLRSGGSTFTVFDTGSVGIFTVTGNGQILNTIGTGQTFKVRNASTADVISIDADGDTDITIRTEFPNSGLVIQSPTENILQINRGAGLSGGNILINHPNVNNVLQIFGVGGGVVTKFDADGEYLFKINGDLKEFHVEDKQGNDVFKIMTMPGGTNGSEIFWTLYDDLNFFDISSISNGQLFRIHHQGGGLLGLKTENIAFDVKDQNTNNVFSMTSNSVLNADGADFNFNLYPNSNWEINSDVEGQLIYVDDIGTIQMRKGIVMGPVTPSDVPMAAIDSRAPLDISGNPNAIGGFRDCVTVDANGDPNDTQVIVKMPQSDTGWYVVFMFIGSMTGTEGWQLSAINFSGGSVPYFMNYQEIQDNPAFITPTFSVTTGTEDGVAMRYLEFTNNEDAGICIAVLRT